MSDLPVLPMHLDEVLELAVHEEAALWELPLGSECGMHGQTVFHPAPDLAAASARLLDWLGAGLIEVVEDVSPPDRHRYSGAERRRLAAAWHPPLSGERAREVLADPTRWVFEHPDGLLTLRLTDLGVATGTPPATT